MITRVASVVNGYEHSFTREDYYLIAGYEYGMVEWNILVEQAYMRLFSDLMLGLAEPIGVNEAWWDTKRVEWVSHSSALTPELS